MNRVFYDPTPMTRIGRLLLAFVLFLKHFPAHPLKMCDTVNGFRYGWKWVNFGAIISGAFWLEHAGGSFDIILCHFGPFGLRAVDLRNRGYIRGKVVTVFHAFDLSTYVRMEGHDVYKRLFAEGDLFIPITEYAKRKLVGLGCPGNKMTIHHMGVDCESLAPRSKEPRPTGQTRILVLGRLAEKKGFEFALRALALLKEGGCSVRLTLVGDGPLRTSLETLSEQLRVSTETHFIGWQTQLQVREHLRDAHIMLMPSVTAEDGDEEGLPVALMEAMATGLPVIATRHAGIPELVENGVTGFLVEERDANALAEKIRFLIENEGARLELGRNARKKIVKEFDINKLNDELVRVFDNLVNDQKCE
jgi:colanic acid/amylovoran biosynthesis glycosyltransferase